MNQSIRIHAIVHGRVQGVFFRQETRRTAEKLGVVGWVRNRSDGTVEAVIEGEENRVMKMLEWCRKGPPMARVDDIEIERGTYSGEFSCFDIRY